MKTLLIGCGQRRAKLLCPNGTEDWDHFTTLDINPVHFPTIVADLERLPLPFAPDTFDEIHAYEVLEHTGSQGDAPFFFAQFSDFWRILKPNGFLCASVPGPGSPWVWGDPGHKRALSLESLAFLIQPNYSQVGYTPMSDYRYIYKADFDLHYHATQFSSLYFILTAVKPSRCCALL